LPDGAPQSLLKRAAIAKENDAARYSSFLRHRLRPTNSTPDRYHALAKIPFTSYLTTNYDSLLLKALEYHGGAAYYAYPNLGPAHQQRVVYFIHGCIDYEDEHRELKLVLTDNEFEEAYEHSVLTSLLTQTFVYRSVCFLGCGFTDEYLQNLFSFSHRARQSLSSESMGPAPHSFALVDESEDVPPAAATWGIEVVRFDKRDANYTGLASILEHWAAIEPAKRLRPFAANPRLYLEEPEVSG
jgi:hypothetical protein